LDKYRGQSAAYNENAKKCQKKECLENYFKYKPMRVSLRNVGGCNLAASAAVIVIASTSPRGYITSPTIEVSITRGSPTGQREVFQQTIFEFFVDHTVSRQR
jgi:hypothetical protein